MREIVVQKPQDSSLVAQLISLTNAFSGLKRDEVVKFDLSKIQFGYPLLVLPLSSYINDTGSSFSVSDGHRMKSYLDTVNFPMGVDSISSFNAGFQKEKTYVPISKLKRDKVVERERLVSLFLDKVHQIISSTPEVANAIYYPITELVNNIFDHSKKGEGYVFAQFYPKMGYLDICIVDRGRGLTGSYKEEKKLDLSDEQAITETLRGNSTKPDIGRGYGVRTSKRVVCEGFGGGFVILSGSAVLVAKNNIQRVVELGDFYWQGVIIAYRIPRPTKAIDIYPYLE